MPIMFSDHNGVKPETNDRQTVRKKTSKYKSNSILYKIINRWKSKPQDKLANIWAKWRWHRELHPETHNLGSSWVLKPFLKELCGTDRSDFLDDDVHQPTVAHQHAEALCNSAAQHFQMVNEQHYVETHSAYARLGMFIVGIQRVFSLWTKSLYCN